GALTQINPSIIAGSALSVGAATALTAGRGYGWMDWGHPATPGLQYWIQEIDLRGRSVWHGPLVVSSQDDHPPSRLTSPMLPARSPTIASPVSQPLPRVARPEIARATHPWAPGTQAVKLGVNHEGWYRVSLDSLARLGLDVNDPTLLHLYAEGQDQAFQVRGRSLQFYGLGLDTPSTDIRVYWVVDGDPGGPRISKSPFGGGVASPPDFPAAVERQDHTVYFSSLLNGDLDNFFGDLVSATPALESLDVPHVSTDDGATVEVGLQGVTDLPHQVQVSLNGVSLGEMSFDGQGSGVVTLPASGLVEGSNTVSLQSSGDADLSLVDHVLISYPHTYEADSDQLRFTAPGGSQVSVGGFTASSVRVVDVTDPAAPVELAAVVTGDSNDYSAEVTVPGTDTRTLLAFGADRVQPPAWSVADQASAWGTSTQAADMVLVTTHAFAKAVAPLVSERQTQGLTVAVVDVTDAYDEFNYGEKDPQAIRDLMSYATTNWQTSPRFLMLFGLGTYDPRGYLGGSP
ncbi:MAG TPA: C25 family cysteine peptidase, partial [Actinomycetota bacterium]